MCVNISLKKNSVPAIYKAFIFLIYTNTTLFYEGPNDPIKGYGVKSTLRNNPKGAQHTTIISVAQV